MKIEETVAGDVLELRLAGRLDATWAEHLDSVIAAAVRRGSLLIAADLSQVSYISSAGIGILVKAYRELSALDGAFWISKRSDAVTKILSVVGLLPSLTARPEAVQSAGEVVETASATLRVTELAPRSPLRCRLLGRPELLEGCRFEAGDLQRLTLAGDAVVVGVGAFGEGFDDSRQRFGELLAAGGAAAYLPTDGSGVPDFLLSAGAYVPELLLLHGVACDGPLPVAAHFEAKQGRSVGLRELAEAALRLAPAGAAVLVLAGEPSALVGAALRRSPAAVKNAPDAPFGFPEVRRWLSLTSESGGARRALLACGVVARAAAAGSALARFVRPLDGRSELVAHLHGAGFVVRQMPVRTHDVTAAVARLFEHGTLRNVLHLLTDESGGETELVRGTLWCGPLVDPR